MNDTAVRSAWRRNGKWLLALGATATLAILVVSVLFVVRTVLRSSDVYRQAVAAAKNAPAVAEALGAPIGEGLIATGHISVSGPSGSAELAIPLSGPKGDGTLFLAARKSVDEWVFSKLVFAAGGTRLDLLRPSSIVSEQAPQEDAPVATAFAGASVTSTPSAAAENDWIALAQLVGDVLGRLGDGISLERLRIDENGRLELRATTAGSAKLANALVAIPGLEAPSVQDTATDARTGSQRVSIGAGLRRTRHATGSTDAFLAGRDFMTGYTEVLQRVKQAVAARAADADSCATVSTSDHRDASDGTLRRAVVQVRLRCEQSPLIAILAELEGGKPDLFIGALDMNPSLRMVVPGSPTRPPMYDIRFLVFGYQRQDGP